MLAYPPLLVGVLFGAEIGGAGVIMSRPPGIALIGVGVACWPANAAVQQLYGMLAYSTLAMLYLIRIGIQGEAVGVLLWPGVVAHVMTVVLLASGRVRRRT